MESSSWAPHLPRVHDTQVMWLDIIDADFMEIAHGDYPWGHPLLKRAEALRSIEVRSESGQLALVLLRERPELRQIEIVAQRVWTDESNWLGALVDEQLAQTHPGWTLKYAGNQAR